MKFRVFTRQDEGGVFVSEVPELPGCISQGDTREDAVDNIGDAISGCMAGLKRHNGPIPLPVDEEPVAINVQASDHPCKGTCKDAERDGMPC